MEPFFGNPLIQRRGQKARENAKKRSVATLPDPKTYAFFSGLMGDAPDEVVKKFAPSVFERTQRKDLPEIEQAAETGFKLSILGAFAPGTKGLPVGASIEVVPKALQGKKLKGLPDKVMVDGTEEIYTGFKPAQKAAEKVMRDLGLEYVRPEVYAALDPARAKRLADAFEAMKHNPNDPVVRAAYQALADETMEQYAAARRAGLKVEFMPESGDPYGNPRNALKDVYQNNHMYVFPTDEGFGGPASMGVDIKGNPLLELTDEKISGKRARVNDLFRVVHDYFGHSKEGVGFRAGGEENAWQQHASMFSPAARRAMTSETRGQNSWVNFGPFAEKNRKASPADTEYAPQKIGLLPEWAAEEGHVGLVLPRDRGQGLFFVDDTPAPAKAAPKKKEAPAVRTGGFEPWDSSLWSREELARLPQRPDVPQADLERYDPKRGASARAQDLADNKPVWKKYNALVDRGLKMGADAWYNAEPLRRDFIEANGPELGEKFFRDYMRMVAASSTGSAVPENARNASYYFVNQGQLPKATPLPQPYGHKMQQQHLRQALDAEAGKPWDLMKNPKPASFEQNLVGNWKPATVDKHSTRGPAMLTEDPRWLLPSWQEKRKSGETIIHRPAADHAAGKPLSAMTPLDYADVPNANEYGLMEDVFQRQAKKMGVDPAQYQAGGWIGAGELTGLGSPPLPFLQVLEQRVLHTAKQRGETPAKVYRDFLERKKPLLGAGALGPLLAEDDED